jgi:hypothetical protein
VSTLWAAVLAHPAAVLGVALGLLALVLLLILTSRADRDEIPHG